MKDDMTELTRETIDPEEYYSPALLMRCKIFPWWESNMTFMAKLQTEQGMELFKPVITQGPTNRRFKIKGENVLKVLAMADAGELKL